MNDLTDKFYICVKNSDNTYTPVGLTINQDTNNQGTQCGGFNVPNVENEQIQNPLFSLIESIKHNTIGLTNNDKLSDIMNKNIDDISSNEDTTNSVQAGYINTDELEYDISLPTKHYSKNIEDILNGK